MNDQFKVGTICIGQNFVMSPYRNEAECSVIGGLEVRRTRWPDGSITTEPCYRVHWADDTIFNVLPHNLRRKPPKQSDSQWADEAVRKLKKQSSDHVSGGSKVLIQEEA